MTQITEQLFDDCKHALEINNNNLIKILKDNSNTAYGKEMNFSSIKDSEDFRRTVPVTDFTPYNGRICKPGEFTVYPIRSILTSSGTTGQRKLFPLTEESLKRYSSYFQDPQYCFSHVDGRRFSVSMHHPEHDGVTIFSYAYYYWLDENGLLDCDLFAGGRDFLFCDDEADIPYVKVWIMLSDPDLEAIQSLYLYEMTTVFQYMESDWKTVIDDMKNKHVSAPLSEKYKALLLKYLPSDERIAEIEKILSDGFEGEAIAKRLWKKIALICGIGGKMYSFQERMLKKYIGDLPVAYHTYSCSECVMAAPVFDMPLYVLLPNSAYFEFIPVDSENDEAVNLKDLKLGQKYEPVVTNFSGMYRYRVNDIIKVRSFIYDSPVFEIVGRRKYLLDIAGEKLDAANASAAIDKWASETGIPLSDFAMCADTRKAHSRYLLFIEAAGDVSHADPKAFDNILRDFSFDYDDVRRLHWLDMPEIIVLKPGDIAESNNVYNNMAHTKPHIFLSDEQMEYLLTKCEKYDALE